MSNGGISESSAERALVRWLFQPLAPGPCSLFRGLLAVFVVFAFWPRGLELRPHLLEVPGLAWLYGQVVLTLPYHLVLGALVLLFGLGWSRRWAGVLLAALLTPLTFLDEGNQSRQVLVFVTCCASLLPTVSRGWPGQRRSMVGPAWPLRLIQLQLTVLYGINALFKATPSFMSGEVLVGLSGMDSFHADLSDGFLHLGALAIPVWMLGTGTVLVEGWLAIGFWIRRLRVATAVIGVLFHLMLSVVMTIFMLDYVSCFLYLAFLLPMVPTRSFRSGP